MKKILALAITVMMMFPLTACGLFEQIIENRADRTYTIHFNANGGEGKMDDYLVESGDSGWLPKCTFTKERYECVAWGLDPQGTSFATQIDNLTFGLPANVKNGDTVELYAIWTTPGFSFKLNTMGYFASTHITNYSGNASQVIVPAWYEGSFGEGSYGSCHIDTIKNNVFMGHTEIESVKNISVNYLSDNLFNGCTSLKTIEMRNGYHIYDIGDRTFYNCSKLQGISLTPNLDSIGDEAFYMCTSIEKLVIPTILEDLGNNAFFGWTENQVIEFTKYSENPFGNETFNGCNATIIWSGEKTVSS